MSEPLVRAVRLGKEYSLPDGTLLPIFRGLDFELAAGDIVAVMGASGVGKTTFLNLLGALDRPTEGTVILDGDDLFTRDEKQLARIRNAKVGFVFQFFHLLPEFTTLENVALPLFLAGRPKDEALERARAMLAEVKIESKAGLRPTLLSGGERQRVAIARALVNEPRLLLADEPTGNLDARSGEIILGLLTDLHGRKGLSSILVTHNDKVARFCRRTYVLESGELKRSD